MWFMRSWTIAFSLGVVLCSFVPELPLRLYCFLGLGLCLLLHILRRSRLLAAFGLGCSCLCLYGWHSVSELLPFELENQDIWVQGTVWSLPQQTARSLRFEFMVDKLCALTDLSQCDFSVLEKRHQKILVNDYQNFAYVPGQKWQLQVKLRRPHGFANPGGFDYEAWLMQQQVRATGYVRANPDNLLLADGSLPQLFNRWRFELARKLAGLSAGTIRHENLVRALTIGDGHGISETEWDLFSQTGTNHLMVISGSHVALIALFLYRLSRFLYTRCHRCLVYLAAPRAAALAALAGAFVYTGLAGFSLPALRALIMVSLYLGGVLLCRQTNPINALCLALALILALDPLASQNAGFWLSFGAVAILLFSVDKPADYDALEQQPQPWWRKCRNILKVQLLVFSGLLPIMLVYFHQVSLTAPLVNIVAIPFIGLLVVPLSLVAMALLWMWPACALKLLLVIDYLLGIYLHCLQAVTELIPVDVLKLPSQSLLAMLIILLLVWLLQFAPQRWQKGASLLLLPTVLFWPKQKLAVGALEFTVLDVGQGLAVVAATRNHALLYDAGPAFSARFDAGSDVVVPYLQYSNITHLDTVMISHADADHAGGLPAIEENFPDARYTGSDISIFDSKSAASPCRAATSWDWDEVHFAIIHPDSSAYGRNNGSCVLQITAGSQTILLPGDIERLVEVHLIAHTDLQANILIAPHHGSRTSSSPAFIAEVQPEVVVFSSGYLNRFGHPAADVVDRYKARSSLLLNTAASGALTFSISAEGGRQIMEYRRVKRRFWSTPQ
jgi:competence protein ComEC